MIQWFVGRKTSADAHIQKAIQYLNLMKSGRIKPNEKDKFCIKQCERKYTYNFNIYFLDLGLAPDSSHNLALI